ncbi:hypothetical protein [Luteimonas sp. YGD11-2]|uniref:hypothetical protein n=1 Tax=Luteimonas sp. YGD11-2 TaxID=2508168 RepID=UPI00100AF36F|nr:hypothetical protein [Luteimonas sp. YGD11-2]
MSSSITLTDAAAVLALMLSAYATWKTVQFNNRQRALIETQEQLNRRLLAREEAETNREKRADLGATFIKLGSSNYRLRVFNKGKAAATNVRISFPDGDNVVSKSDVDRKFPMELLEPHQSVELLASIHMGSRSKHKVVLNWADEAGASNEKTVYATV